METETAMADGGGHGRGGAAPGDLEGRGEGGELRKRSGVLLIAAGRLWRARGRSGITTMEVGAVVRSRAWMPALDDGEIGEGQSTVRSRGSWGSSRTRRCIETTKERTSTARRFGTSTP